MRTTITSREFNQDTARAKREAESGPVFITDRGVPAYVLLSVTEYRRLEDHGPTTDLVSSLAMPGADDIAFTAPKLTLDVVPAELA